MTKEEFKIAFNMGRSYSNMPYGFTEFMENNWKYKDAENSYEEFKRLINR